jgi:hypothetical protein
MSQYDLPDEITLALAEAGEVLLALYDARDSVREDDPLHVRLSRAIRTIRAKLAPDLPE